MIELNKMAAEIEDIERDITGKNLGSKRYPWDRMADAIKSIADRAGATLPDKKYSTKKAFIADALEAIAGMDFPRISVPDNDVRFIDYDGTVLYSYSTDDFLQMTAMPANPDRTGDKMPLTSQGWNWSFEDAQAYVTKYGKLNVGQMYIPSDGKTHMILDVGVRKTIPLMIQQTVSEGVIINWGDGSEEETIEGTGVVTTSHTYAAEGEYEITLEVADGCALDFGGTVNDTVCNVFGESANQLYISSLKKVFIGNSVTTIGQKAFQNCNALTSLTIPDSVTSIGQLAFGNCYELTNLVIPDHVTSIGQIAFMSCFALTSLSIPDSITSIGQVVFGNCCVLTNLTIPDGVTSIGSQMFWNCYALTSLTIPDSVTSIEISAFQNCFTLTNLDLPDGVTSIEQTAFQNCNALTSLTIPDSVTSIKSQAFGNCYKIYILTVLAETPPTLANVNAFGGMPTDCTIYVPHGKGDTYKAASGWSTWASQIQELPE